MSYLALAWFSMLGLKQRGTLWFFDWKTARIFYCYPGL